MTTKFISAKYNVSIRTVDYAGNDGRHLLRTGGTIAWRFNNPGNIRPAEDGRLIMGAIGIGTTKKNGSFLIFDSYEAGRAQKRSLLRRIYNGRTIYTMLSGVPDRKGKIVMGYAPATDKNDPVAYANFISEKTGFSTDTVLSTLTDEQLDQVMDAMEIKEGFHGMRKSRSERWIDSTGITISDGAIPKPGLPARIKIGDKSYDKKTDAYGQLPRIAHTDAGQKVEIYLPDISGQLEKQFEFVMDHVSRAYVLFHNLLTFEAASATRQPSPARPSPQRAPVRYVVKAGQTLKDIAELFQCSISSIQELNPAIRDINKIYAGQVLSIYGRAAHNPPSSHPTSTRPKPAPVTRSKEGAGQPLAIVPAEQRQAPWMVIAIEEGKKWAGRKESIITKEQNYHKGIGKAGSLANTAWCASFINFCLKSVGVPYESNQSSQFPCGSKKFIKIDKPVYGALMVLRNYVRRTGKFAGTGHVTFVYGRGDGESIVGLGGNQGDTIRASRYKTTGTSSEFVLNGVELEQRFHGFYIPAIYSEFVKTEGEAPQVDRDKVNVELLGIKSATKTRNEGTR